MLNQRTTYSGIATILAAIAYAFVSKDWTSVVPSVTTGLGLILAADAV